tara:strand:- start:823 stop:1206 length:384 start_codon:yes stop_codon:yes gene_type:complete
MSLVSILKFCRKHWKELLMAALLVTVIGKFRYDYRQLELAYEASQESLEEQLAGLKQIHEIEIQKREEALDGYREAIAQLEKNYLDSQIELEKTKQKERRERIKEFSGDKQQLIEEIKDAYGFKYIP